MVIPQELLEIRFDRSKAFGYKPDEVDRYVAAVNEVLLALGAENDEYRSKLEALASTVEGYRDEEESLKSALIGAQKLADRILKDARAKAEALLSDAQSRAEQNISEAQVKADGILSAASAKSDAILDEAARKYEVVLGDLDSRAAIQKRLLEEAKEETMRFKSSLIEMYKDHLERVFNIPVDVDDMPAPPEPEPAAAPESFPEPEPEPVPTEPEPIPVPEQTERQAEAIQELETKPADMELPGDDLMPTVDFDSMLREKGIDVTFFERQDGQMGFDKPEPQAPAAPAKPKRSRKGKFTEMKFGEGYDLMKD